MADDPKRTLVVTGCKAAFTGQGQKGEYTIYEVTATSDGQPVALPLRSFDDLTDKIGQPVEYEVSPYTGRNGTTYTLKPPREKFGPRIERLESRVKHLEERLEEQLAGGPAPAATSSGMPPASEDDIPF